MNMDFANLEVWQLWVVAAIGLGLALAGFRIKKIAFFLIWFVIGFSLMEHFMPTINGAMPDVAKSSLWQFLLPVAGGLLLALLGFSIEKLCVGGICFGLVMMITARYFGTDVTTLVIGAIIGILVAGFAVTMIRPASIIATAVAGAYLLSTTIVLLFPDTNAPAYYWTMLIGVSIIGSVFQFTTCKGLD